MTEERITRPLTESELADKPKEFVEKYHRVMAKMRNEQMRRALAEREPLIKPKKVGRNEKCPCGSGVKYKRCCGR